MKRWIPVLTAAGLLATFAAADAIHTWGSGATVRAGDLNGNFTHVHSLMVGGGKQSNPHNLLVDSDVDPAAAIQSSKIQNHQLFTTAWGYTLTGCASGSAADTVACTIAASDKITRISSSGTLGQYRVYLSYTPTGTNFMAMVHSLAFTTGAHECIASSYAIGNLYVNSSSVPQIIVSCANHETEGAGAESSPFAIEVFDNN